MVILVARQQPNRLHRSQGFGKPFLGLCKSWALLSQFEMCRKLLVRRQTAKLPELSWWRLILVWVTARSPHSALAAVQVGSSHLPVYLEDSPNNGRVVPLIQ